jgi:F1F0 ATPase subunit 2
MTGYAVLEICRYLLAFIGGIATAIFFLTALWWSLERSIDSRFPVCLFLFLGLVRIAVVMYAFFFFASGDLLRLFACVAGFAVGRRLGMSFRFSGRAKRLQLAKQPKEDVHASDAR